MTTTPTPTQPIQQPFQAEVEQLLDLVIHSLYTHREIFLRELVSNASDALDKLRIAALKDPALLASGEQLLIRVEVDAAKRVVRVVDNGIGMSRAEVIENLGTIARSGTKRFVEQLKNAGGVELPRLIGQFGVGFYASFMVAKDVVVETRKAGETSGTRWRSNGKHSFSVEEIERAERGTSVELHLAEAEEGPHGTLEDFTQPWRLREIVKRYSDFVEYPIEMAAEGKDGEPTRWETVNSMRPLWARPRNEIQPSEYADFYKAFTSDWEEPLETIHLQAEGGAVWQALLFIPRSRPLDMLSPAQQKSEVHLYVKRVHIAANCEELVPAWLRFVRGLVDSDDLPLNISRETLQHNRRLKPIQSRITRKVLDAIDKLRESKPADFATLWQQHGIVLKEGIWHDDGFKDDILKAAVWSTTHESGTTTLAQYVERMPFAQKAIYAVLASDLASAQGSPHLEACRKKGFEVLLFTDPVDEFVLMKLTEFGGKPVQRLDRGVLDLDDDERAAREAKEKEHARLLEDVQHALKDRVESVRLSSRLVDSPAVLAQAEGGVTPQLERFLRQTGQPVPPRKQVLELNPDHAVTQRLVALREAGGEPFERAVELVHGLAAIAEGETPGDPKRFAKALAELLARA